jgi:thioesterase domain-containing protein
MLDVSAIGIHDSFFDLGGHSLLAVRMLRRVADEIGDSVSLREFYVEPTIAGMVRRIFRLPGPGIATSAPPILKLRGGTKRPPLLYLNGQPAGAGLYALKLPRYLHPDQPVYVVRTPIFDGIVTPESLAATLIERIREELPNGPYVLAGNCFGAWIALEIARQLVTAGEQVPLVGLLHPVGRVRFPESFRVVRQLASLCGVPEEFEHGEFESPRAYTASIMKRILNELRQADSRRRIAIAAAVGRSVARYGRRQLARTIAGTAYEPPTIEAPDVSDVDEIEAHRRYWWDSLMAYTPREYSGRILVMWPREARGNHPWNPIHDWSHLSSDLEWRIVPGTHDSMVREHFEASAHALEESIEEALRA